MNPHTDDTQAWLGGRLVSSSVAQALALVAAKSINLDDVVVLPYQCNAHQIEAKAACSCLVCRPAIGAGPACLPCVPLRHEWRQGRAWFQG